MNKAELRVKWSKYCNTDKLVSDTIKLLKQYKHPTSENGVCTLLDTYFTQKEPLIKLFVTSKNYIGDMRIVTQKEFDRQISLDEIRLYFENILEKLHATEMLDLTDEEGKSLVDYLTTGSSIVSIDNLPNLDQQAAKKTKTDKFCFNNMATQTSNKKYMQFNSYMQNFRNIASTKLGSGISIPSDASAPVLKAGTKTSRAFNTVCCHYGVDKFCPTNVETTDENGNVTKRTVYPYNKVFATYSDLVSDLKRKMYFIISLNPLDYLTMSFGVSWISCHNIKSGGYKGGCLSYMLDNTSIITFVVNELTEDIHNLPKYYRQMFHYDDGLFVQSRLYPQGNDGATDLYEMFRGFVIEEFANLLHENGEWDVDIGREICKRHIYDRGMHYPDYKYNNSCNIFYPKTNKDKIRSYVMNIGHDGICVKCGRPHTSSNRLAHYDGDC